MLESVLVFDRSRKPSRTEREPLNTFVNFKFSSLFFLSSLCGYISRIVFALAIDAALLLMLLLVMALMSGRVFFILFSLSEPLASLSHFICFSCCCVDSTAATTVLTDVTTLPISSSLLPSVLSEASYLIS